MKVFLKTEIVTDTHTYTFHSHLPNCVGLVLHTSSWCWDFRGSNSIIFFLAFSVAIILGATVEFEEAAAQAGRNSLRRILKGFALLFTLVRTSCNFPSPALTSILRFFDLRRRLGSRPQASVVRGLLLAAEAGDAPAHEVGSIGVSTSGRKGHTWLGLGDTPVPEGLALDLETLGSSSALILWPGALSSL